MGLPSRYKAVALERKTTTVVVSETAVGAIFKHVFNYRFIGIVGGGQDPRSRHAFLESNPRTSGISDGLARRGMAAADEAIADMLMRCMLTIDKHGDHTRHELHRRLVLRRHRAGGGIRVRRLRRGGARPQASRGLLLPYIYMYARSLGGSVPVA